MFRFIRQMVRGGWTVKVYRLPDGKLVTEGWRGHKEWYSNVPIGENGKLVFAVKPSFCQRFCR